MSAAANPDEKTSRRLMSYETFENAVRDFLPYLLKVNLYDEGEPMLNPRIFDMIRHLARHDVSTCVSSNFSINFRDADLEALLDCGLEHLVVAVDGATQHNYACFRRGGNLDLVMTNLRKLMALKKGRPRSPLRVELQFIEFEHNRADWESIATTAHELQLWRVVKIEGSSVKGWRGTDFQGTPEERRGCGCYQVWVAGHINSDGSLGSCDYGEDFGLPKLGWAWDYHQQNLRNHPDIVRLRQSFASPQVPLNQVCRTCSLYRKKPRHPRGTPLPEKHHEALVGS